MMIAIAAFALLAADASGDLLRWMDRTAQAQLDARGKQIEAIRTKEQAVARQREVRSKILELIGGLPDYDGPLNSRVTGLIAADGFRIEKVVFESLPRFYVTGNLYVSDKPGKHAGVLFTLGHWEQGKPAAQLIAGNLARKGFVVFAYDPVGQGERLQAFEPRIGRSLAGGATEQHILNGAQSLLVGESFARYRIWDAKRALDYLASRPEVDSARLGCTGCSGGGTVTTYISALDDRIKVAIPACYMNTWRFLFTGPTGDSEQTFPGFLQAGLDQADFVELFAPKPWMITSTEQDFFKPEAAKPVYEEAMRWYAIYGAEDRVKWVVGPGGHGTPKPVREAIYDWFIRWIGDSKDISNKEEDFPLRPDYELRVGSSGQVALDYKSRELYEIIRERLKPPPGGADPAQALRNLIAHKEPANLRIDGSTILFDPDEGLTLEARLLPGSGAGKRAATLVVQNRPEPSERARAIAASGETVLVLVPRGLPGSATERLSGDWVTNMRALLIGRSLPAMRAHDILCGIDILIRQPDVDPSRIHATAEDAAGIWLLMAAAADPRIASVDLQRTPVSLRQALDAPVTRGLHDGIIQLGVAQRFDLPDIVKAIAPRTVTWTDPMDWMRNPVVREGPPFRYTSFGH
jgi:cephalosporin-C deacetylase-like acetyl esterase